MIEQLASELNQKNYITIMIDGEMGITGKENKTFQCRYVKYGKPVNWLVGHEEVAHAQVNFLSELNCYYHNGQNLKLNFCCL